MLIIVFILQIILSVDLLCMYSDHITKTREIYSYYTNCVKRVDGASRFNSNIDRVSRLVLYYQYHRRRRIQFCFTIALFLL